MAVYQLLVTIISFTALSLPLSCQSQSCPEGMIFKSCGTACPRTCDNLHDTIVCTHQCVLGCFCASGTVLNGEKCVQESECMIASDTESSLVTTSIHVTSAFDLQSNTATQMVQITSGINNTINLTTTNMSPQKKIYIIVGSIVGAVVIILLIVMLIFIIIGARISYKKSQSIPSNNNTLNGTTLYKRKDEDVNYISVGVNEAYATGAFMYGNIAYTTTEKTANKYGEEYEHYI